MSVNVGTPVGNTSQKEKKLRIRKACDSCNAKRTKCDGNTPCSHCAHIKIECTYLREEKRRGRASAKYPKEIKKRKQNGLNPTGQPAKDHHRSTVQIQPKKPVITLTSSAVDNYTTRIPSNSFLYNTHNNFVLGETRYPILNNAGEQLKKVGIPFSVADELLSYYFDSEILPAPKVFSILRKIPMLESRRPTKPALLLSVLLTSAVQIDHAFFVGSNRDYACQSLYRIVQELLPANPLEFELDDLITTVHLGFLMPWLSYPSDSVHWWRLGYQVAGFLRITEVDPKSNGDVTEEKLRAWWGLYILDRLTALCFNCPILISDAQCREVYIPYDEFIWSTTVQEVTSPVLDPNRQKFHDSTQVGYDLYGWSIPTCSLMGNFIEYKMSKNVNEKAQLKQKLIKLEHSNSEALNKFQNMIQTISSPAKEAQATLDILYAKFINHVLSFITIDIEDSETLGEFANEVTETQLSKLSKCIELLEEILKLDENLHTYPFLLSFFLFVSSVSFISVLNNLNAGDHAKINRIKYFVKVLVRAIESVLVAFPSSFLKMVRNQLAMSIKDCENLILLTGYSEKFEENSKKRKNALKAYNWGENGRGIAV